MKVAVTGASGHLGNVICRLLKEKGHEVQAIYHTNKRSLTDIDVNLIKADVLDTQELQTAFEGAEIVINCAAIISIHGDPTGIVLKTNTEGPRNVIAASIACGVKKIIHISSTHAVQEQPLDRPMTEVRPYKTEKNYAYDYSKAKGEQIMLEAFRSQRIEGVVIRPSSIIGPFDYKPSEMGKALLDIKSRKIPILPPGGYDFIDVRDAAAAVVSAMDKGRSGEVYLVTGNYYSIKEFTKDVGKVLNSKVPKHTLPFWLMVLVLPFIILFSKVKRASPVFSLESILALKNGHTNMDNSKAKDELNLKVRDLSDTFTDFFDWNKRVLN